METAGTQYDAFVEYVDLLPTVPDLCGVDASPYMGG